MTDEINTKKFIHASLWAAANSYLFFIINFFGQIILAKLLFPHDYGLYAFSLAIVEICVIFLGFGNTSAFINSPGTPEDFNASFKLNLFSSCGLCLFGIVGCLLSIFIHHDIKSGLFFLLLCIANSLLLLAYVFMAPLQKSLNFKTISFYNGACSSISLAIGILLAKMHFSYWSLAIRDLLNYVFFLIVAIKLCPLRLSSEFLKANHQEQLSFGLKTNFSRAMEILYIRFSDILVQWIAGKFILGNFYQARALSHYPVKLLAPLNQVMFSFFSHIKHDNSLVANRLNWINIIIVRVFLPILMFIFLYGKWLFILVYGEKWALAGQYFEYFAFWIPISSLFAASTSTAYSLGKQWIPSMAFLIAMLIFAIGMIFLHHLISPPIFFTIGLGIGYVFFLMMLKKSGLFLKTMDTFFLPMLVLSIAIVTYWLSSALIASIIFIVVYGLLLLYEKEKVILIWKNIFTRTSVQK